ncbi:glycoside hydrolase family 26 protein [Mucilaginibacter sp. RS28]|uniref:Glycoside hydrolase family 26 protein n=1 Tax=Mucilaginibacter straminoryzae TaxID=2932774 RepID=A0A9X1X302_9SPHI|nr:glycosyl hydrolase [Mucilaginibacter straminoryzae]MCJ8210262.1 glycoside hydrolase family 26 protein [Mucilaginibacter straminoryzae]
MKKTTVLISKFILVISLTFSAMANAQQLTEPCDVKATKETRSLYSSLQRLMGSAILFGHHDDTAYGINWRNQPDSSDVKSVSGSYPAIYGWDLAKIEHDSTADINGVAFADQRRLVKEAYQRGGINTFCWHADNPVNGKTAWDTTANSVKDILPDGSYHDVYVKYLEKVAKYLKSLKGKDGEAIPILFRPFHELTGGWFWWGTKTTSPQELIDLWRFTIDYLRKKQKVHNLLVVYSTADFNTEEEFLERYPGDDYVDVMGFDLYCDKSVPDYVIRLDKQLQILQTAAGDHQKLACLAETGYQGIPSSEWWTKILLPELIKYNRLSYVMAWRNANQEHYFVPIPGHQSAADFKRFANDSHILLQNRLSPLSVYGKALQPLTAGKDYR